MSHFQSYEVVQPPTSRGVEDALLIAIQSRSFLPLDVRPVSGDIGTSEELEHLEVKFDSTRRSESGGLKILGSWATGDTVSSVHILTSENPDEAAHLDLVIPD